MDELCCSVHKKGDQPGYWVNVEDEWLRVGCALLARLRVAKLAHHLGEKFSRVSMLPQRLRDSWYQSQVGEATLGWRSQGGAMMILKKTKSKLKIGVDQCLGYFHFSNCSY